MNKIFSNKWVYLSIFSLILTVLIFEFAPSIEIRQTREVSDPNARIYYDDLNSDHQVEMIVYKFDTPSMVGIKISTLNERVIDQWNIFQNFVNGNRYMAFDYDHDQTKEIFLVTEKNDSLFLQGIDINYPDSLIIRDLFLYHRDRKTGSTPVWDIQSCEAVFIDYDRDGKEEMVLAVMTGYGVYPRKIFVISLTRKKVIYSSKELGTYFTELRARDIDQDGEIEFYARYHSAPANMHGESNSLLDDHHTYFFVLNKKFKPKFPPIKMGDEFSGLQLELVNRQLNPYFIGLESTRDTSRESPYLSKLSIFGELLQKKELDRSSYYNILINKKSNQFFLHNISEGKIFKILPDLSLELNGESDYFRNSRCISSFLYKNQNYFVFLKQKKLIISDQNYKISTLPGTFNLNLFISFSTGWINNRLHLFITDAKTNNSYVLQVTTHPAYRFRYIFPVLIFGFLFLFESLFTRVVGFILHHTFLLQTFASKNNRLHVLISNNHRIWSWKCTPDFPLNIALRRNKTIYSVFRDYPSIIHFINQNRSLNHSVHKKIFIQHNLQYRMVEVSLIRYHFLNRWPIATFISVEIPESSHQDGGQKNYLVGKIMNLISDKLYYLNSYSYNQLIRLEELLKSGHENSDIFTNNFLKFKEEFTVKINDFQQLIENLDIRNSNFTNVVLSSILLKVTDIFKEMYPDISIELQKFHMDHDVIIIKENFEYLILQIFETIVRLYPGISKIFVGSGYVVSGQDSENAVELEIFPVLENEQAFNMDFREDQEHSDVIISYLAQQQNIQLIIEEYPIKPTYKLLLQTK